MRACDPPESWGICCLPAIFKFIAMAKVRGFAKQQLDAFCQLYSVARRDGCTVQEKCQPGKRWGIKREKAMQFEVLLAGSSELQEATLEPARVREVLEPLLAQQPVRETPTEEAAALPSFPERIADAMLELRRDRLKRGIVGVLAKKYEISERSILRYRKELKFELERDPPIIEEVFRMLVRRKLRSLRGVEPQKATQRLVGMLARKGHSPGIAYRVVREELDVEFDGIAQE